MGKSKLYRIVIIDDHRIFTAGFKKLIEEFDYVESINAYNHPDDFLKSLPRDNPDVVFMDVELPGLKGYDLARTVSKQYPSIKIIALTFSTDGYTAKKMLEAGICAYMTKGMMINTIHEVFDSIEKGIIYIAPEVKFNQQFQTGDLDLDLSQAQIQIIKRLSEGKTSREIAKDLKTSERKVELEKTKLFKKLRVESSIELVTTAFKLKILT